MFVLAWRHPGVLTVPSAGLAGVGWVSVLICQTPCARGVTYGKPLPGAKASIWVRRGPSGAGDGRRRFWFKKERKKSSAKKSAFAQRSKLAVSFQNNRLSDAQSQVESVLGRDPAAWPRWDFGNQGFVGQGKGLCPVTQGDLSLEGNPEGEKKW